MVNKMQRTDDIIEHLSDLAEKIRGHRPILSPIIDDFELLQYFQPALREPTNGFRIVLDVGLIKVEELTITIPNRGTVEIEIKHDRRVDFYGFWMTRDCTYTFELPNKIRGKELYAEWTDDNYLIIQVAASEAATKYDVKKTILVPQLVRRLLKPEVEIKIVKCLLEDIREAADRALRNIRAESFLPSDFDRQKENEANGLSRALTRMTTSDHFDSTQYEDFEASSLKRKVYASDPQAHKKQKLKTQKIDKEELEGRREMQRETTKKAEERAAKFVEKFHDSNTNEEPNGSPIRTCSTPEQVSPSSPDKDPEIP